MATRQRPPTMQDVADIAGVSQTTVSFVLNGRDDISISGETKERVLATARDLGYRPNAMARSLRISQSQLIGLVSDEIASTPHAVQIVLGAQDAAWEHDRFLLMVNTGGNQSIKDAAVPMMLEHRVDSIIYATMYHRMVNPPPEVREVPCVLLDCFVADRSLPSVVPDERQGGKTAVDTLLQRGHRRIGFINNTDTIPATIGRLAGYREALATYGVPFDDSLVRRALSDSSGGYAGTMELMQLAEPPTAIFCFNDRMAMGAYDALRKFGRLIPDHVAVIGFDDEELIAAHLYPPLTTVKLPHYAMGRWAVNFLMEHAGTTLPPIQHVIECPLVTRASV